MQENRYNTCDRFLGGLEKDFIITEQIEDSPLTSEPSFLDYGIIAVCNRGSAIIHLLDNKHVWNKNELIFLFPRQLCSMRNVSEDGSPDKPGGLSIQLCKSEKKEFYIRYSS